MGKTLILHPFLIAIFGVLFPLARNINTVGLGAVKMLFGGLALAILLVYLLRRGVKHPEKAGLLSSALLIVFFSFGHVDTLLSRRLGQSLVLDAALLVAFALALGGWVYWVLRRLQDFRLVTNYLNIVGALLVVVPVYSILTYTGQTAQVETVGLDYQQFAWQGQDLLTSPVKLATGEPRRDIYYIILDGYTRADVLQELYGYDNSEFIRALEARGFYVAQDSCSNYGDTVFSISSSLNMAQIETAPEFARQQAGIKSAKALKDMLSVTIEHNRVRAFLDRQGYDFVDFDPGYDPIKIQSADYYERSPDLPESDPQSAFELLVLDSTLGKLYMRLRGQNYKPLQSLFAAHRGRIVYTLENLPKYARREGAYFIYAHVVSPHAPYVFGPNGEARNRSDPYTLLDNLSGEEWRPDLYRDQVIYINKLVLRTIDEILARSDPEPIIIIQGDHSSRSYQGTDWPPETRSKLLFPILNAYHLPGVEAGELLYPRISPVNSFRLIFNRYFGTGMEKLADRSYLMDESGGLEFEEVSPDQAGCAKP